MNKIFFFVALLVSTNTFAELNITIIEGQDTAEPIAVVPFHTTAELPVDVASVIAADLRRSGRFEPLPESMLLERPSHSSEVDYVDWRYLNVDKLVIGRVDVLQNDRYVISFELLDVLKNERVIGFRIPARASQLRASAHRISDLIFEALTGIPGIFSTRVAYVSKEGQNYSLVVADADGENKRSLVDSTEPLMSPAWSPDAKKIAYVGFGRTSTAIYVQDLASGSRQKLSEREGVNGAPSWHPDGKRMALTLSDGRGNLDIYMISVADGRLRRMTEHRGIDTEAVFGSDGRYLYFTSDRGGSPQIYRMDIKGGEPKRVTFEGRYNARPRVSPNGEHLALVHQDKGGEYRIAVMNLQTAALRVLSRGQLDESPSFAANSDLILYAAVAGNQGVLASVSVDGRVAQRLSGDAGDIREPTWSPFINR